MELERKYGQLADIWFPMIIKGETNFASAGLTFEAADVKLVTDGGGPTNATNTPTHVGGGLYHLVLEAAEMEYSYVQVILHDDDEQFEDQCILIKTYGDTSAAVRWDFDTVVPEVNVIQIQNSEDAAYYLSLGAMGLIYGSATGVPTTVNMATDLTETEDDQYKDRSVVWISGVLKGQAKVITAYDGTAKVVTFEETTSAPSAADEFIIV